MRPSASSLLRIRPVPSYKLNLNTIRLPDSQRPAKLTRASAPGQPQDQPQKVQLTIAEQLLKKEKEAAGTGTGSGGEWPRNLRVIKFVHNKDLYWNVPAEKRDELKKLLREE